MRGRLCSGIQNCLNVFLRYPESCRYALAGRTIDWISTESDQKDPKQAEMKPDLPKTSKSNRNDQDIAKNFKIEPKWSKPCRKLQNRSEIIKTLQHISKSELLKHPRFTRAHPRSSALIRALPRFSRASPALIRAHPRSSALIRALPRSRAHPRFSCTYFLIFESSG